MKGYYEEQRQQEASSAANAGTRLAVYIVGAVIILAFLALCGGPA